MHFARASKVNEKRLRAIYNIVLGANVGFLPFLALELTRIQPNIDPKTAIAIWLLTTIIIVNEWWAALDLWKKCPPTSRSNLFFNLIYVLPLLALPFSILIPSTAEITLLWYAILLLILPIIDCCIVKPHLYRDLWRYPREKRRPDVMGYIYSDIWAIGLFAFFIVIIIIEPLFPFLCLSFIQCPLIQILILFVAYAIEFLIFYRYKARSAG